MTSCLVYRMALMINNTAILEISCTTISIPSPSNMSGLADSLKSFKRSLVSQPVYGVKRAAAVAFTANDQTISTLPIAGNAKVALDGITDAKKKSKKANTGMRYTRAFSPQVLYDYKHI